MEFLTAIFALVLSRCPDGVQTFTLRQDRTVVSDCNNYSFRVPANWHASATSLAPYLVSFSPKRLVSTGVRLGVPRGGAEIGLIADAQAYRTGSLSKWIETDNRSTDVISTENLTLPGLSMISDAVRVTSRDDEGDSFHHRWITNDTVYFKLGDQLFAFRLRYNQGDPKRKAFETARNSILQSFRPKN